MLIADENIDRLMVSKLRKKGYEVFSIREKLRGIPDSEIVVMVKEKKGILITEDKDFRNSI